MRGKARKVMAVLLCAVLMAGALSLNLLAAGPSSKVTVNVTGKQQEAQAREVLTLINQKRAEAGAGPLIMADALEDVAEQRAAELAVLFSHTRPDGTDCFTAADRTGLSYRAAGENIASGYPNAASVVEGWMNSTGHRENILDTRFTHIGIGCFEYNGTRHWVQFFMGGLSNVQEAAPDGADGIDYTTAVKADLSVADGTPVFLETNVTAAPGSEVTCDLAIQFANGRMEVADPASVISSSSDAVTIQDHTIQIPSGLSGTVTLTAAVGGKTAVKTLNIVCEHVWGEWQTEKEATWEEEGLQSRICGVCKTKETRGIPKLSEGHVHDYTGTETVVKEATCTEEGSKTIACTDPNCKETKTEVIPAKGHAWGEWKTTEEATWEEEGLRARVCSVCEAEETEGIPKLSEGHVHDYTGTETVVKEATCTEEGSKTIACTDPNCKETKTEVIPAKGHAWGEWKTTEEATWETEGIQTRICADCQAEETRTLPKLSEGHEHDFTGTETVVKEATCTEEGEKTIACSDPNCKEVKTEVIKALGHEEKEIVKEATCTETGTKELVCSRCGLSLKKEIIPATGHDFGDWKTVKKATEKEEGERERVCRTCGYVEKQKLDKVEPKDSAKTGDDTPIILFTISFVSAAVILVLAGCIMIEKKRRAHRR